MRKVDFDFNVNPKHLFLVTRPGIETAQAALEEAIFVKTMAREGITHE